MANLYTNAAKVIEKVLRKQGSPKTLVFNNENVRNKKKLYALVCEALKFKSITEQIMEETGLLSREKQQKQKSCKKTDNITVELKLPMALVLLYDFLFGKGLHCGGKLKLCINRNKTGLHAALARMKVKARVVRNEDLLPQNVRDQEGLQIPRYVRVNTLKATTEHVVSWFCTNGHNVEAGYDIATNSVAKMTGWSPNSFSTDAHIPDVLVFPPKTDLHDHPLYCDGKIILQDKASCFPAFVLSPPPGSFVIDACAAPGNKTSHLAAVMRNKGKIFAFDIAAKRIKIMKRLLHKAGEEITEIRNEDFLKMDPEDSIFHNVQYILVDPSCSGSGIINRLDYALGNNGQDTGENQRLESLAQFQTTVLSHALTFPQVKKVVYSTCSLHDQENEEVVQIVLERFRESFTLANALPEWPYRGHPIFAGAENCVRASPAEGRTSGFFLALFTRIQPNDVKNGSSNEDTCKEVETEQDNRRKKKNKRKRKRDQGVTLTLNSNETKESRTTNTTAGRLGEELVVKKRKMTKKKKKNEQVIYSVP